MKNTTKQLEFRGYTFPAKVKLPYSRIYDLKRAVGARLWAKLQKDRLVSIIDFEKNKAIFTLYKISYNAYDDVQIEVI